MFLHFRTRRKKRQFQQKIYSTPPLPLLFFQNSLRDNLAAIQHLNRQFGARGSKLEVIRAGAADEVKVSAGKAEAPPKCDKK